MNHVLFFICPLNILYTHIYSDTNNRFEVQFSKCKRFQHSARASHKYSKH